MRKRAGVILLNLPLALIGGVFILKLTSGEVSIPAIIGFISLFGIATRNGMLLISHYTHLRTVENVPLKQAVLQGSMDRLNPILMTALSSALACNPACAERRFARQRDTKSDGDRYLRRSADIHFPERLHHPDCLFINE